MAGTDVAPTTAAGGRRMSDSARAKISEANRARWAALPEDQKAAQRARLAAMNTAAKRSPAPPAPAPAAKAGPRNPLVDALGDSDRDRAAAHPGRSNGVSAPPRFVIPDLPPLEPAAGAGELADLPQPTPDELGGFTVDVDQIADLVTLPFDFVADRRGAHWRLKPIERERLAGALTRKINQHAAVARAIDAGGDWAIIVGGFAIVISTRLAEDARNADSSRAGGSGEPARPGLAGLTFDRGSGAGRGAPATAAGAGPGPVQLDGGGPGGPGSLNGYGTPHGEGDPAVAAEATGRLAQSLG